MAEETLPDSGAERNRVSGILSHIFNKGLLDTILCLDLGSKTGWAVRESTGLVTSGVEQFQTNRWQGGGMRFLKFKRWITDLKNTVGGLDAVYFEEVRAHVGVDAAHAYGGWLATLTAWCEHHGIPYSGVPVGTIKKAITGKGNANKKAVIQAVRALGYTPADDNEADALALLKFVLDQEVRDA